MFDLLGTVENDVIIKVESHPLSSDSAAVPKINGLEGDDIIVATDLSDLAAGDMVGDEWIFENGEWTYNRDDVIVSDYGADTSFNDTITTGAGNDVLLGNGGDDMLNAGGGNDRINAGLGNDIAFGGYGDDILNLEDGDDVAEGGYGDDMGTTCSREATTTCQLSKTLPIQAIGPWQIRADRSLSLSLPKQLLGKRPKLSQLRGVGFEIGTTCYQCIKPRVQRFACSRD